VLITRAKESGRIVENLFTLKRYRLEGRHVKIAKEKNRS
jgi:hypothetical protein